MRKLFATFLFAYLTLVHAPLVLASYDCGGGETYESAAEACYWCGAGCDDTTDEEVAAVAEVEEAFEESESSADEIVQGTEAELDNAIEAPLICPTFGIGNGAGIPYGTYNAEQKQQVYETFYTTFDSELADAYQSSSVSCGDPNDHTGFLEKGDCTAEGLVVTEITEVLAPDVTLDENTKIITVYSGLCCLAGEVKDGEVVTCDDVRTIYTTDDESGTGGYDKCTTSAVNCEKRQWVIGGSGIGIVKLMVKQIFTFGALAVGSIAVGTIVFQGIKISVSGVSGDISESKNKILQAIAGIVLLFLSGLLLYTINPEFFGS